MEAILTNIVAAVNDVLWNKYLVLLFLLLGSGIYFTIRTGFVQVRKFGEGMRLVFGNISLKGKEAGKDGMSSFQALATAIAAQVGTGNIAGCASALVSGGPGAVFWMWVSAFFGMATIYGEAVLAQKYKEVSEDGAVSGGPIYYIKAAFKGKLGTFMAGFFAVAIILALGFMGNMVQSNSIGDAFYTAFGVPKIAAGIVVAAVSAFIFLGGVKRIAAITEKLVPIMAIFYICGALIAMNAQNILPALQSIFVGAFTPQAVMGGAIGISIKEAVRFGVARGLFSNEAGMGSTPHAHAMAKVEKPQDQGAVAMVGVFIDTFIVLTLTALVILTSGMLGTTGADGQMLTATALAQAAFNNSFGSFGNAFVAICLLFFAFSTIVGWYFFGESNVNALFKGSKKATFLYGVIALVFIVVGSFQKVTLVWDMSDMFNGLMVIPNLLAVLALSGIVAKFAKDDTYLGKE